MNEETNVNNEQMEAVRPEQAKPRLRPTTSVVCELSYERREVAYALDKLNKAIDADPQAVSAHHKDLWRKQAKAMQEYVDVLGERIKDLIDNG
jgi:hypothetical protein